MDIHAHKFVLDFLGLKKPIECKPSTGGISMRKSTINRIVEAELDAYEAERDAGVEFVLPFDDSVWEARLVGDVTPEDKENQIHGLLVQGLLDILDVEDHD